MRSFLCGACALGMVTAAGTTLMTRAGVDLTEPTVGIKPLLEPLDLLVSGAVWKGTAPLCTDTCSSNEMLLTRSGAYYQERGGVYRLLLVRDQRFGSECWFDRVKPLCAPPGISSCSVYPTTLNVSCESISEHTTLLQDDGIADYRYTYWGCSLVDPPDPCAELGGKPLFARQDKLKQIPGDGPGVSLTIDVEFSCCM